MKITDGEIRQAVNRRLSALDDDPFRKARIMKSIAKDGDAKMKRKMSLGLVLAIILVLALSGVALALMTNLFDFFGKTDARYEKVARQAALETTDAVTVEDTELGEIGAAFESAFYDGMTLNAAIAIRHSFRVEEYTPNAEELASFQILENLPTMAFEDWEQEKIDAQLAIQSAVEDGTIYGYRMIQYYLSDHVRTNDGIDIPPSTIVSSRDDRGNDVEMREFESPLPEELQSLTSITLNCKVLRNEQIWYYNGQTLYYGNVTKEAGIVHADVPRSDGMTKKMQGSYSFGGKEYVVTAQASPMNVVVTLEGDETTSFSQMLAGSANCPGGLDTRDKWINISAHDEQGRVYRSENGYDLSQTLPVRATLIGVGELPETLTVQIFLDWEGASNHGEPLSIVLK